MTPTQIRPRAVGALLTLLFSVLATGISLPAASALPQAPSGGVGISLSELSPAVLTAGGSLTVTALVHNGTQAPLTDLRAVVASRSRLMTSRSEIDSWTTKDLSDDVGRVSREESIPEVAPGGTQPVTFVLSPEDLQLSAASLSGPRGLTILIESAESRIAALRTFVAWAGTDEREPVRLTVLAAVTGPPIEAAHPDAYATSLAKQTSDDGRLARLLAATAPHPEIGWVIDPQLVQATADSAVTLGWRDQLLGSQRGRDVVALPSYDIDLAAFAHNPEIPTPTDLPITDDPTTSWRRDIAWPADAKPDIATANLNASRGTTTMVVRDGMDIPEDDINYSPNGVGEISTSHGPVTALIADPVLSSLLTGGENPVEDAQRLLAETSVIVGERPGQARELLAVLDRSWSPDVEGFEASFQALDSAPWVEFSTIDALRSAEAPSAERDVLPEIENSPEEIPGTDLSILHTARASLTTFASITAVPAQVIAPLEPGLVAPTSIAFRGDAVAREDAVQAGVEQATTTVQNAVTIVPRKTVRLLGEDVKFPVLLRNDLDQDVSIQLVLASDSDWLLQNTIKDYTIPAKDELSVLLPVQAIATGVVIVDVHARGVTQPAGTGPEIAKPIKTRVVLSPELDTVGTWVVVVGVALLLVGGIWRTIRRGHSPSRTSGTVTANTAPESEPAQ